MNFPKSELPGLHMLDNLLGKHARSKGAVYISTLDAWREPKDFYYWRYEPHLNMQGHRALADLLKPEIEKLLREKKSPSNRAPEHP